MKSKELQDFLKKLKKQKSQEYWDIFVEFKKLFEDYFKKQAKYYLEKADKLPLQKTFDNEVEKKLKKALQLGENEELDFFKKELIRVGKTPNNIIIDNKYLLEYAQTRAGALIKQVDETTEKIIQKVFNNAFKYGYTKQEIAEIIKEKFDTFAGTRATLIAHMEIANAYAYARNETAKKLKEKTIVSRWKRAKTQQDDKVRPSHKANEADGWIPENQAYSGTGTLHAPHGFFCRCDDIYTYINPNPEEFGNDIEYSPDTLIKFDNMFEGLYKNYSEKDKQIMRNYSLNIEEYTALQLWSGEYYRTLVNGFDKADTSKEYQTIIPFFQKALSKLPFIEGMFYRGHKDYWEDNIVNAKVGDVFTTKSFLSFSKDLDTAKNFAQDNIILVVKTSKAKDLSMIEGNSLLEKEVIILPKQGFTVEKIKKVNNITYIYLIENKK